MSDLGAPLKTVADAPVDETTVRRMWREIGQRRARARFGASTRRRRAAILLAAALALGLVLARTAGQRDAGPLRRAGGAELAVLEEGATIALDDGSVILLGAGARLTVLEDTSTAVMMLLEVGRVTFDVRPGGPRRWTIECGLATVDVVGTRFAIERRPGRARVEVERGVVLVRGEIVKDRIQRLTTGESLDLEEGSPENETHGARSGSPENETRGSPAPETGTPAPPPSAKAAKREEGAPSVSPGEEQPRWQVLARRGAFNEAYDAIEPSVVAREAQEASAGDLLLLADVARLSGHPAEAVAPLSRVIRDHARDARAPIAAFTLGRVQLDALGQPAAAADAFARAIALGLPQALREDAYARVVEARARAGDRAGARAAAAEYQARYREGSHLAQVRAWIAGE